MDLYENLPQALNFEPFRPGQQQALINQHLFGYGQQGTVDELQERFNGMTAPMSIPTLKEPITETKAALQSGNYPKNMDTGFLALNRLLGLDPNVGGGVPVNNSSGGSSGNGLRTIAPGNSYLDSGGYVGGR